jgi:4-amino-4-deoxy-L-arabinose transferase-like glycosyltransferase
VPSTFDAAEAVDPSESSNSPSRPPPIFGLIRRRPVAVIGIAAVALGVRLAYVFGTAPRKLPFTDALSYQLQASILAKGDGFVQPEFFAFYREKMATAAHPPLYSLFLAGGTWLGAQSVLAHQIMGCVIGVATVIGVGLIGYRLAGERAGLLAMALAAVYPGLWVTDGGIMSEGLFALLTTAIILASYWFAERRSITAAAVLGATIGLAMLTREEAVLLFPILVIPLVVFARSIGLRRSLMNLGVCVVVSTLIVSPWVIRNLATFQKPVFLSDGNGTLLGSNCPSTYYGSGIGTWYLPCYDVVKVPAGADESVQTAAARTAGLRYIEHHVSRVPLVVAARIGRVWEVYQPVQDAKNDNDDGRPKWANTLVLISYAVLAPIAIAGLVILVRRRRPVFPLVAQLLGVTLTAAIVWGAVRFRTPAEVVLVVLGGVAVDALWATTSRHRLGIRGATEADFPSVDEPGSRERESDVRTQSPLR